MLWKGTRKQKLLTDAGAQWEAQFITASSEGEGMEFIVFINKAAGHQTLSTKVLRRDMGGGSYFCNITQYLSAICSRVNSDIHLYLP